MNQQKEKLNITKLVIYGDEIIGYASLLTDTLILKNLKNISENNIGFRFIIIERYAKAFNFYVIKNGFEYLEKDVNKIEKLDFIIERDPRKSFYLYLDLEKIKMEQTFVL